VGFSGYQTMSMSERKMKESERDKKGEDEYYEKHKKRICFSSFFAFSLFIV
jgi:hypothetical protein